MAGFPHYISYRLLSLNEREQAEFSQCSINNAPGKNCLVPRVWSSCSTCAVDLTFARAACITMCRRLRIAGSRGAFAWNPPTKAAADQQVAGVCGLKLSANENVARTARIFRQSNVGELAAAFEGCLRRQRDEI